MLEMPDKKQEAEDEVNIPGEKGDHGKFVSIFKKESELERLIKKFIDML